MAEFKLGRIRFIWKDEWSSSTTYYKDDVVRYGGKTFICIVGHIAQTDFMLDLNNASPKWEQFADGQTWKGEWTVSSVYKINDVVKYGATLWICTTYHTSQATFAADEGKWSQFVEGLEFEDTWSGTKDYQPGDFVTYGGYSYVSKTNNIGNGHPSTNTTDWDLFTTGFKHAQDWGDDSSSEEYRVGDVVTIGDLGSSSLGRNLQLTVGELFSNNELIIDNVVGDFEISGTKFLQYENGSGTLTTLNSGAGGNVMITSIENDSDGLHMKIIHQNHGMHSQFNLVDITDVTSDSLPTTLDADYSNTSTSDIALADTTGFNIFEGQTVDATNIGYIIIDGEIISYTGLNIIKMSNIQPF